MVQPVSASGREDFRRKREIEEARKSGLIPAEKDEEGRDINPHIPQYIAKAPWYLNNEQPSLKHQRRADGAPPESRIGQWYQRGIVKDQEASRKFKKGSCQNCGASTHQAVDCLERPRAKGARWTGRDIAPDEYIPSENIEEFEAKRDRWGGFNPDSYSFVVEEFQLADEEERKRKASQFKQAPVSKKPKCEEVEDDDEEKSSTEDPEDSTRIRDFDVSNAPVGTKDDRTRTTTRNLRIREDTAKYLINLDLESAFYDPKTRSMRGDPTKGLGDDLQSKILYRGDNAVRNSGETLTAREYEMFAWDAYRHGNELHQQAHPTQLELTFKEHTKKKRRLERALRKELLDKYGGAEHLHIPADLKREDEENH